MKRGFSLAEMLITLTLIAIVTVLTIPVIVNNLDEQNKALYKSAFKLVESAVNELVSDSSIYPTGSMDNTICSNLTKKLNTVGTVSCSSASSIPNSPNFITTNGMRWYGFENTVNFLSSTCPAGISGNCMKIHVDINGIGKGVNIDGKDILEILITQTGRILPPEGTESSYIYGSPSGNYDPAYTETGGTASSSSSTSSSSTSSGGTGTCSQNCYNSSTSDCVAPTNSTCSSGYTCQACTISSSSSSSTSSSSTSSTSSSSTSSGGTEACYEFCIKPGATCYDELPVDGKCPDGFYCNGSPCEIGVACRGICTKVVTEVCYQQVPVGGECTNGYSCSLRDCNGNLYQPD